MSHVQLRMVAGPANLLVRAGPEFPSRQFRRGRVTVLDSEEEARAMIDALRRRDDRIRVQEASESGVFTVEFDAGVEAPGDFGPALSALLMTVPDDFARAFKRLLAVGTAALVDAGDDEAEPPAKAPPAAPKPPKAPKPAKADAAPSSTITSANVPTQE